MQSESIEMYQDAHNLFNYGFNEYESVALISENTFVQNIKIENGDNKEISAIAESGFKALVKKGSAKEIESRVVINDITLPLEENDIVGKIDFIQDEKVIGSVNLITKTQVKSTLTEESGSGLFLSVAKFVGSVIIFTLSAVFLLKVYNDVRVRINRRKRRKKYNS